MVAAALLHGIAARQVFENGNKRTAWVAALTLLELNGIDIGTVETVQSDMFVRAAALDHSLEIPDIAEWFRVAHEHHIRRGDVPEPTHPSFRYADEAMALPYAVGVRTNHTDAGVVLEFFVNDPAHGAEFIIFQRVLTAPETLIQLAANLEQRYTPPPG